MTYRALGKQVLRDNEHFADAVDTTAAQIIADALNDRCTVTREPIGEFVGEDYRVHTLYSAPIHHHVTARPDGDYQCSCGRGWDRDEGDECPATTS